MEMKFFLKKNLFLILTYQNYLKILIKIKFKKN
jgi:hypothetical protein